ncbi:DUF2924 domain-containing protein [Sansalvadorimonas verongulae]|uniref:DUF2924 domain-containing protein n=1 Tax=Sansalvadorimonas verongulae TaxID=2172824 RepID=UPI0012BBCC69|nr:DUF2924 domain-containing protein [Sansalvadorimonas verongulae]MTI12327.1 DUF2924 domain-containing protein [Sansalvadorimonas verongulae]
MMTQKKQGSLAAKIAGLPKLSNIELHKLWRDLYDKEPPKLSRLLIIQKLAWRIQEVTLGGLEEEAKAQLDKDIRVLSRNGSIGKPKIEQTKAGVIFERIWNGKVYRVKSLEKGFEYEGAYYRSLSAIVREITGQHTSGPRFFGIKSG